MRKGILDIYLENERNHLSKEQNFLSLMISLQLVG